MSARIQYEKNKITVFLEGELDHHSAAIIRASIDDAVILNRPKKLVLDFGDITFMDSSGIGLVMGRYRLMNTLGGEIEMVNLSPGAGRIMKLAGLEKLGKIQERECIKK